MKRYKARIFVNHVYECYIDAEDDNAVEDILDLVDIDDCRLEYCSEDFHEVEEVDEPHGYTPLLIQTADGYTIKRLK